MGQRDCICEPLPVFGSIAGSVMDDNELKTNFTTSAARLYTGYALPFGSAKSCSVQTLSSEIFARQHRRTRRK